MLRKNKFDIGSLLRSLEFYWHVGKDLMINE